MDWKHFFKPTLGKLILAVILFVIFVPFFRFKTGIVCITTPCPTDMISSVVWYMIIGTGMEIGEILFVNLIFGVIIIYTIVCGVFYAWEVNKKKPEQYIPSY